MSTLAQLSRELGVPESTLLQEALETWLFKKIAEIDQRIVVIAQQYGTESPDGIEALIRDGTIDGHPAWEDAIRLEGLQGYRHKLWQQIISTRRPIRDD